MILKLLLANLRKINEKEKKKKPYCWDNSYKAKASLVILQIEVIEVIIGGSV